MAKVLSTHSHHVNREYDILFGNEKKTFDNISSSFATTAQNYEATSEIEKQIELATDTLIQWVSGI